MSSETRSHASQSRGDCSALRPRFSGSNLVSPEGINSVSVPDTSISEIESI